MGKRKAPDPESIDELEARLADMKKAQSEKHPQGRPKWSKCKALRLVQRATCQLIHTDANTKEAMPSKSVKAKPQAKLRGCELMKIYCGNQTG
jgi:hypothetical protein